MESFDTSFWIGISLAIPLSIVKINLRSRQTTDFSFRVCVANHLADIVHWCCLRGLFCVVIPLRGFKVVLVSRSINCINRRSVCD